MREEKNPIEARLPHKVINQATRVIVHAADEKVKLRLMRTTNQESIDTVLKMPHHAKW